MSGLDAMVKKLEDEKKAKEEEIQETRAMAKAVQGLSELLNWKLSQLVPQPMVAPVATNGTAPVPPITPVVAPAPTPAVQPVQDTPKKGFWDAILGK